VRTEAAFVGIAISGATLLTGFRRWPRRRWIPLFLSTGVTAVAAAVLDRIIKPTTYGVANPAHATDPWGGVVGRIEGFQRTWLSPGNFQVDVLILVIAVIIFVVGLVGFDAFREPIAEFLLALGFALAIARVLLPHPILAYGLAMACPLLIVGLIRGARLAKANAESRFCLLTFGLFAAAVLLTQYRFGGVAEWGGRYFAVGLPFAVVVAVPGLATVASQFPPKRSLRIIALAVGAGLVINLGGIRSLADSRATTEALTEEVAQSMATVTVLGPGAELPNTKPVVVSTVPAMARLAWDIVDEGSWLLAETEDLESLSLRLTGLDVQHFTLVTADAEADLAELEGVYTVESWDQTDNTPLDVIIVTAKR
jgi:hypothetical protein